MGLALGTLGLPFVQAALGEAGLRVALVWDMVNTVAGALCHMRRHTDEQSTKTAEPAKALLSKATPWQRWHHVEWVLVMPACALQAVHA